MLVAAKNVTQKFASNEALSDVSVSFSSGSTTAIIGPSGCGKSSLLRVLMGLTWPDRGAVEVDGVLLERRNVREMRRRMGYVIQEGGLFPHLTAYGNVALQAQCLGWTPDRIRARSSELAELVHLSGSALERYPNQLSGGQKQRVALMRALMLDPAILLLDEPFGALDPVTRRDLQNELKELCQRVGKTTVLVTHDLHEAAFLAERIVLMSEGRVVQQGTLGELVCSPNSTFVTTFVNAHRNHSELLTP